MRLAALVALALLHTSRGDLIQPEAPRVYEAIYINGTVLADYEIRWENATKCKFRQLTVPCGCVDLPGNYSLYSQNKTLETFYVLPPRIKLYVPTNHQILRELTPYVETSFCASQTMHLQLSFRPFEVLTNDSSEWRPVVTRSVSLHNAKTAAPFQCEAFHRAGFYKVSVLLVDNTTTQDSQWISVNDSAEAELHVRSDSIFPHCDGELMLNWKLPKCASKNLDYSVRILAVPEGSQHSIYMEEQAVERGSTGIGIPCSQFDILYVQYCFELVSVERATRSFHQWNELCVNTEPVSRADGGWSQWSSWSACSATCGGGIKRRLRHCDSPAPRGGRPCSGALLDTALCTASPCPEEKKETVMSTCDCGCQLMEDSGRFYAGLCKENASWTVDPKRNSLLELVFLRTRPSVDPQIFLYRRNSNESLFWKSSPSTKSSVSLKLDTPVTIVSSSSVLSSNSTADQNGITVIYYFKSDTGNRPQARLHCHPVCPETAALIVLSLLCILFIVAPPLICAKITRKWQMVKSPDLPLLTQTCRVENEMIRSGNTDCTQLSAKEGFITKRSIGIQLSVQSTPRCVGRGGWRAASGESPAGVERGASALSTSDELEYDYEDSGAALSFFRQQQLTELCTEIDIDHIIAQTQLMRSSPVQQQDVHTQI